MDKQALKPVFNIPDFIKKEREKDITEISDEEEILGQGADMAFWLTLKKHIENQIQELDKINEEAIASGMSLEEIGRNTIVISQVKGVLNRIFNIVDDSKEALESGRTK